jgi:hypothetical protein
LPKAGSHMIRGGRRLGRLAREYGVSFDSNENIL